MAASLALAFSSFLCFSSSTSSGSGCFSGPHLVGASMGIPVLSNHLPSGVDVQGL